MKTEFLKMFTLILICAISNHSKGQTITTIAGTNQGFSGDGSSATSAQLNISSSVCRDQFNNVYIADQQNHRIRKIDNNGIITTIAGTGTAGFSGDGGAAILASLNRPTCVAVDLVGNVYFSDRLNNRVRKIAPTGIITTIAGTGTAGFSGDGGVGTSAQVNDPWGLAIDKNNDVFLADRSNNRIRKISSTGTITTIAGSVAGFMGDGGLASGARFSAPISLCFDTLNNLYIADENNNRIRRISFPSTTITTIAGNGSASFSGDGAAATAAALNAPCGVYTDFASNVYISDRMNQRVRKVTFSTGVISTVAGNGLIGNTGDGGPATSARLNYPRELFSDAVGNIYVADADNHRIRVITFCALPTIPTLTSTSASICSGNTVSLSVLSGNLNAATGWQWASGSCGSNTFAVSNNVIISPTITTTYFVRGIGGCTLPYGCGAITVSVTATPTISITNSSICSSQSVTLSPTGATTYTFLNGGPIVTPSVTTTYSVTGSNGSCLSTNTAVATIIVNATPTVIVSAVNPTACAGASNTLTASGAVSYTFNPGNILSNIAIVSPSVTSIYSVTGSNGNCSDTKTINLTVISLSTISIIGSNSLCAGTSLTLTAVGANTYLWNTSANSNSIIVTPSLTTTYSVVGTNTNSCQNSAIKTLTVIASPTISINSGTICAGNIFTLTPSGANSYTFINGGPLVTPTINSSYSVIGTNSTGCVSSNTAVSTVSVSPLPLVSVISSNTLLCLGQTATLSASGASNYTWSIGMSSPLIIVSPTTTTNYSVIATSALGCSNSASFIQSVSPCAGIQLNEGTNSAALTLYPNPTRDKITLTAINIFEPIFVTIYDVTGKECIKHIFENQTEISVEQLKPGVYFIKSSNSNLKTKFIKQ